jgi:hypothetical protein
VLAVGTEEGWWLRTKHRTWSSLRATMLTTMTTMTTTTIL